MAGPKYFSRKECVDRRIELKADFLFSCNHEGFRAFAEQPEINVRIINPASNGKATSS
jgi:hypothetical protein